VVTLAEMQADAARFFGVVDSDRNGEIVPDELVRYEREIAPEISTYETGPLDLERRRSRRDSDYGAPLGAGRFGLLNVPNPIAAADADFNRGVTRAEFAAAIARDYAALRPGAGGLRLATLPPTPQAATLAACAAKATRKRR
jgi:hypothetical protein